MDIVKFDTIFTDSDIEKQIDTIFPVPEIPKIAEPFPYNMFNFDLVNRTPIEKKLLEESKDLFENVMYYGFVSVWVAIYFYFLEYYGGGGPVF